MTDHVRVVVIGGGAAGCSCLYHLAKAGWTDALLLEQDELTSGSTWHAAGNCPTFSTIWSILRLQQYSTELYRRLGDEVDYPIDYHITGSVRLSHCEDRLDEYRYVLGMARANGLEYELLAPEELKRRYPLITLDDLNGALWDPQDGDIDPAQLTQALAKGARRLGAEIRRFTKVTSIARLPSGEWRLGTRKRDIVAEVVVNAAGYRAGEVMRMLGEHLPTVAMSHQYLVTEDAQELTDRAERLPLLRDPDVSYYLRQERDGFILGPYEWRATPMWLDGIPEDFSHKLWNDDLERLEPYIEAACARVPVLGTLGVRRVVNGPIPYSPDGQPYIGPAHGLHNFFHCNTLSFGIVQAGGAGKALAEWVTEGAPEWDLWALDPRRYTGYATQAFTVAKAVELYQNEYAPAFPFEERPAGRPVRTSPLYPRLQAKGAVFGARGGWECATWFQDGADEAGPALSFRRKRMWFDAVGREVRAVREAVGLIDLPGFSKWMVSGPGAERFLDRLVCSRLPQGRRIGLAYALNQRGGIVNEFSITRLAPDRFYVVSGAAAEWHDADLLRAACPADGSVAMEDVSERFGTLVVAGPRSRDVLAAITDADLSNPAFPWLSARKIGIGAASVLALRMTYVGELGWELHADREHMLAVYEAASGAGARFGARDVGIYAIESLRLDKCYRAWNLDLESGFSPLEAGLDRFVDFDKPDFVGRGALLAQRQRGLKHRLVPLVLVEPSDADAPASASVLCDRDRVGIVTSGGWSYTLNRSVALAYLRADVAVPETRLTVDVFGTLRAATVAAEPLYDPADARPRA